MNDSAVAEMLEALSLSRTRRFCMMVEDECANLIRRNSRSLGAVCRLEFPPLTESLRDLISATAGRFGLKGRVLPEGDQEKGMHIMCVSSSRIPTLRSSLLPPFPHRYLPKKSAQGMTCKYQPPTYTHLNLIASHTFSSNHSALCALPRPPLSLQHPDTET